VSWSFINTFVVSKKNKMKKLLFLLAITFTINAFSQCPVTDIILTSQADIDNFTTNYPGCTVLTVSLDVGDASLTDISDLSGLNGLTSIDGHFYVYNNPNLINFVGLENLGSITDDFYIQINAGIQNFNGLGSLGSIGGGFFVTTNNLLQNFSGLSSLTSIGGFFQVDNCNNLSNFSGLDSLETIGNYLWINENSSLVDFTGLNSLISTGGAGFFIDNNDAIVNLNGFDSLTTINEELTINNNPLMETLNGVESLTTIGDFLRIIGGMPNLTDISGISNIDYTTITGLFINDNTSLAVCEELNICTYLDNGGTASISGNAVGCATVAEVNTACIPVLGVDDEHLLENNLSIYPNPVKDILNIEFTRGGEIENVLIYSTLGKLVKEYEVTNNMIDLENLASGIYLLKVITKEGVMTTKIVKS